MNELLLICEKIGILINEVIDVVLIKWNFMLFCLGLVGGYCIGVDFYYIVVLVEKVGYYFEVILVGW